MKALVSSPFLVNLEKLSINSTAIGDHGVAELLTGTGLNSLQELHLQDNGIGAEGAAALAASPLATRLKSLDLSFNRLGDSGAEALARGPAWQQLQELKLRDNEISFGGASAILASPSLEMLQSIDISANPLRGQLDVHSLADDKITLMEESFAKFSSDGKRFADHFYGELFTRYPGVKPLFAHTTMSRQQQHLFSSLVMVIENLRRPDAVAESLNALGKRHVGYGVSPTHYYAVTSTLLDTIKEMLGDDWTDSVQEAWTDGLEAVSRTMMNAHRIDRSEVQSPISETNSGQQ
jgi:hemoglobin-like flavoprotein